MPYFRLRGKNNLIVILSEKVFLPPDRPVTEVIRRCLGSFTGLERDEIEHAARTFLPLEHRSET